VAALDASAVVAAIPCVSLTRLLVKGMPFVPQVGAVVLAVCLLLLAFHAAGLYRFTVIAKPGRHSKMFVFVGSSVAVGLIALGVALEFLNRFPRVSVVAWLVFSLAILLGFRFMAAATLRRLAEAGRIGRRIVIYGAGQQGRRLAERIKDSDEPWNRVIGVFDDRSTRREASVIGIPVSGGMSDLLQWGQRNRPDEILLALPWSAEDRILGILHQLAVLPSNVRLAPEFQRTDLILGCSTSQFGLPMITAYQKPVDGWGRIWKRLFDFGLAVVATLIALPVLLLIALLVRLESPGPVLFSQPRFGFNNKLINVYKFRSMRAEASDVLGEHLTERGDCRITRVGAVIRRYSLDELPQLLNVIRGEMSLVGPRPHAIRTTAGGKQCDAVVDQYAMRHKVKPGITGWAQVNGLRGTMETEEHLVKRVEHDVYYINNWSPLFDIKILLLTVWAVFNGRNSY
jgi:Undecaprenyl-phosphate glucose phosphotransferase